MFDAVSAILDQALTELKPGGHRKWEAEAAPATAEHYSYAIDADTIDFRETDSRDIVLHGSAREVCLARFHNTVSAAIAETCRRLRAQDGLTNVRLSGGTFQNAYPLAPRFEAKAEIRIIKTSSVGMTAAPGG